MLGPHPMSVAVPPTLADNAMLIHRHALKSRNSFRLDLQTSSFCSNTPAQ